MFCKYTFVFFNKQRVYIALVIKKIVHLQNVFFKPSPALKTGIINASTEAIGFDLVMPVQEEKKTRRHNI